MDKEKGLAYGFFNDGMFVNGYVAWVYMGIRRVLEWNQDRPGYRYQAHWNGTRTGLGVGIGMRVGWRAPLCPSSQVGGA